jgi:hypothetical protein
MRPLVNSDGLKRRLIVAGMLALAGIGLTVADRLVASDAGRTVNDFASAHASDKDISAAVDALLGTYAIDPRTVTSWKVLTPDKKFLRLEQRVVVPHDFPSVEFNHKLTQKILPFGARVAATERSKENVVTMHVMNDGVIIRTIVFAMRPYEPSGAPGDVKARKAKGTVKRKIH